MRNKNLETYLEFPIKEVNGVLQYKDKEPVLGESTRKVRISNQTAKVLNSNASNFGKVYILEAEKVKEPAEKKEQVKEVIELEKVTENNLEKLRKQAKELGVKGVHLMKEDTLQEKINEKLK